MHLTMQFLVQQRLLFHLMHMHHTMNWYNQATMSSILCMYLMRYALYFFNSDFDRKDYQLDNAEYKE